MGAGGRECGFLFSVFFFCFPVGVEKSVDTFPPVTGTSGQMGEPNYEGVQGGEAAFLRFAGRRHIWMPSSKAVL